LPKAGKLSLVAHDAHAPSATARRSFNDHRKADLPRPLHGFAITGQDALGTWQNGHPRFLHRGAGLFLFAHQPGDFRWRPNESDVAGLGYFGEIGVLRQQSVSRMDSVDVRDLSRADDCRNVEVALRQLGRTNADRFVGKLDVQRVPIGLAVNRHGADAQLFASANDAQGNLATVRNKNFIEHVLNECGADTLVRFFDLNSQNARNQKQYPHQRWRTGVPAPHDQLRGRITNNSCPYSIG
jgi:hypothetical protein